MSWYLIEVTHTHTQTNPIISRNLCSIHGYNPISERLCCRNVYQVAFPNGSKNSLPTSFHLIADNLQAFWRSSTPRRHAQQKKYHGSHFANSRTSLYSQCHQQVLEIPALFHRKAIPGCSRRITDDESWECCCHNYRITIQHGVCEEIAGWCLPNSGIKFSYLFTSVIHGEV